MSQKTVSMDKVQQITRLFKEGVPIKEIVRRLSISRNSVKKYVKRLHDNPDAKDVVLSPEIAYGSPQAEVTRRRYEDLLQYFSKASCDLGRTGVTRENLWGEYILLHANEYSYSQCCHHLKRYDHNSDLAMHLEYKPGDLTNVRSYRQADEYRLQGYRRDDTLCMLRGHPALQRTHLCDLHACQKDDRPCHRPERHDPILRWCHGFFVAQNYKSCHGICLLSEPGCTMTKEDASGFVG